MFSNIYWFMGILKIVLLWNSLSYEKLWVRWAVITPQLTIFVTSLNIKYLTELVEGESGKENSWITICDTY